MLPPLPRCSSWAYSSLIHPAVSAFPERGAGSACTSSFSGLAQRSLTLRPAHSRGHLFVTRYPKASDISSPPCLLRLLPAGAISPGGPYTHWKAPPFTAHPLYGHCYQDQARTLPGRISRGPFIYLDRRQSPALSIC